MYGVAERRWSYLCVLAAAPPALPPAWLPEGRLARAGAGGIAAAVRVAGHHQGPRASSAACAALLVQSPGMGSPVGEGDGGGASSTAWAVLPDRCLCPRPSGSAACAALPGW